MTENTVTGLICAECCNPDVVRALGAWCDCEHGEQCIGPCRQRAHSPVDCPFRTAYVPQPTPWRAVQPGDTIRLKDGPLVHVTGSGPDGERWRIEYVEQYWTRTWYAPATAEHPNGDPDYPVPVLVPYAEHAARLVLRVNGLRTEVIGRG